VGTFQPNTHQLVFSVYGPALEVKGFTGQTPFLTPNSIKTLRLHRSTTKQPPQKHEIKKVINSSALSYSNSFHNKNPEDSFVPGTNL